jgi:hypothetical protein
MSRRIAAETLRDRAEEPEMKGQERSSVLGTVHTVEIVEITGSGEVCKSPLCDVPFPQTGLKIEPRRFCCGECRQQASIIKRAAKLLKGLSDERVLEIIQGAK